jgi:hypothetical protein
MEELMRNGAILAVVWLTSAIVSCIYIYIQRKSNKRFAYSDEMYLVAIIAAPAMVTAIMIGTLEKSYNNMKKKGKK